MTTENSPTPAPESPSDRSRDASTAESPSAAPAPDKASRLDGVRRQWVEQIWPSLRPRVRQTWLNLQIWIPFLQNPTVRARKIVYWGREHREGLTWCIGLPAVCWQCDRQDGLRSREYDVEIRAFEYPLEISAITSGTALFLLLLAWWLGSWITLLLMLVSIGGGLGLLMVKSWQERVRMVMWTCAEHADAMIRPDVMLDDNQLHVVMPTPGLAAAAQAELNAERRRLAAAKGASSAGGGASGAAGRVGRTSDEPVPPTTVYKPTYEGPKPVDLPPIKLVGDDDEPKADA